MLCTHNPCTLTCHAVSHAFEQLKELLKFLADALGDLALAGTVLLGGAAIGALPQICTA